MAGRQAGRFARLSGVPTLEWKSQKKCPQGACLGAVWNLILILLLLLLRRVGNECESVFAGQAGKRLPRERGRKLKQVDHDRAGARAG